MDLRISSKLSGHFHWPLVYLLLLTAIVAFVFPRGGLAAPKTPTPTATPNPIKIGAFLSLSSVQGSKARQMKQAIELAIDKLKATGGINGRPVELFIEDSGIEGVSPGTIIKSLVTDRQVDALIGDVDIEKTQPFISLANTYRTPLLAPALQDSALSVENSYVYGLFPRAPTMRIAVAAFFETVKPKSIVILCTRSVLGSSYLDLVHDAAQENSIAIDEEICVEEELHDFRVDMIRVQGINPGSLFLTIQPDQALQWMKNLGISVPTLASAEFPERIITKGIPSAQFEGTYYIDWPIDGFFAKEYATKFGASPILSAALATDAVALIVAAFKKSPDSVVQGLRGLREIGVTGSYDFSFEQAGNNAEAKLFRISNGEFKKIR